MKVIAIVQARMGSTRLPKKVMKPIGGIPMIELLLQRLAKSTSLDQIVLATSTAPLDKQLSSYVQALGFEVFEGSETDVLDRFYRAALRFKGDVIVRITGDCPLIDPNIVDQAVNEFLSTNVDYLSNTILPTFPDGLDVEVFSFDALEKAAFNARRVSDREHVTPYLRNFKLFRLKNITSAENFSAERWTVDEPEDFEVVSSIFQYFYPNNDFSWLDVLSLRRTDPEIFEKNMTVLRNEGFITSKLDEIQLRNITDFTFSDKYRQTVHQLIPGGAHTYSKGDDQFPALAPAAISYGKGAHVWDVDGNQYLDCSMGLTSVSLGHAYEPVLEAIKLELEKGVNFQRPSVLEKTMAEKFLEMIPQHDMVKFAKNGSIVTTAAVKLARAKTGRKLVAFPGDHPFYSYDDWFIGTTACSKGVPDEISQLSVTFKACDLASLRGLFEKYPGQIACVISEPEKNSCYETCACNNNPGEFLRQAIDLCHENGALFIVDEMVTGFKTGFPGSISKYNIEPDMATWGKGIANGFSFCALTGKRDVMELGGISQEGQEKVFLISTTHGGETHGMAAALATIEEFKKNDVVAHIHYLGKLVIDLCKNLVQKHQLEEFITVYPSEWMPAFTFRDNKGSLSQDYRTLFMQEMIKRGVLFQGIILPTYSHTEDDIYYFAKAFDEALHVYSKALTLGVDNFLVGKSTKPVFRRLI